MSCAFDLGHYRELLEAAHAGGYRFSYFDHEPEAGDLLLRHDVDLSLEAALAMAEVEAEADAVATYFLMTRSEFYNLHSPSGDAAIERLRGLGHRVGLHAVWPQVDQDPRFDAGARLAQPRPRVHAGAGRGADQRDGGPVGRRLSLRLEPALAAGVPARGARAGAFEQLQLLTHPEIWVYPGATMRETMLAMLDAERELRLGQLAADRIDLS